MMLPTKNVCRIILFIFFHGAIFLGMLQLSQVKPLARERTVAISNIGREGYMVSIHKLYITHSGTKMAGTQNIFLTCQ
jgi:hypothetical protein